MRAPARSSCQSEALDSRTLPTTTAPTHPREPRLARKRRLGAARLTSVDRARSLRLVAFASTAAGAALATLYWWQLLGSNAVDLRFYYQPDLVDLYGRPDTGARNGTNYSPAFFQLVAPLGAIPFDVLAAGYRAVLLGLLVWMAGPFTLPLLLWYPVASEINAANIQLVLAAAVCIGFRYPAAWAFVLLTKVSPGIGLLWFALNGKWRSLGYAVGATVAVVAVSGALLPGAWLEWFRFVLASPGGGTPSDPWYWGLTERLPISVAFLVLAGARRWPVAIAATMALPVFYLISPSMIVGAVYLARRDFARSQPDVPVGELKELVSLPSVRRSVVRRLRPDRSR